MPLNIYVHNGIDLFYINTTYWNAFADTVNVAFLYYLSAEQFFIHWQHAIKSRFLPR